MLRKIFFLFFTASIPLVLCAQPFSAPNSYGATTVGAGNYTITGSGTVTFASFIFNNGSGTPTLTIPAGVTMIVTGTFELKNGVHLILNGVLRLDGPANELKNSATIDGNGALFAPNGIDYKSGATVFGGQGSCTSGCGNVILPVALIYFRSRFEDQVILEWATATEINNDYFSIERSEDGSNFYEIGRVSGNGNSKELNTYHFTDSHFTKSIEYYRLKQVDFDGLSEYFEIKSVATDINQPVKSFSIYPTVIENNEFFFKSSQTLQIQSIIFYHLSGKELSTVNSKSTEINAFTRRINFQNVQQGLYLLKILTTSGEIFSSRIIIR